MINIVKQTPEEYNKQSRDFQIISRLYTALFNMNKMYADNLQVWDKNIDNKLTHLRAKTLNFNPKHNWDLDALEGVISSFKYLMFYKGTEIAIKYCTTMLMRINNLEGASETIVEDNNILIKIPTQLANIGVLKDLFDYIIPAGMTYRIIEYKLIDNTNTTKITSNIDNFIHKDIATKDLGIYLGTETSEYSENQGTTIYKNIVSALPSDDDLV